MQQEPPRVPVEQKGEDVFSAPDHLTCSAFETAVSCPTLPHGCEATLFKNAEAALVQEDTGKLFLLQELP